MTSPIRPRILCCWPLAVAIGLAGLLAQGSCALAQTATRATLPGDPTLPGVPSRVRPEGPFPDDSETAPDLPAAIPSDDPTRDPEDGDPLEVRPAAGQRPAIRDGDLSYPAEPRAPVDGLIDPREPEPVLDGVDPLTIDTRPREDIDAFENPPAGYDPLLFQIEDIDPLSDRRTRRLAKLEPYDPVGIRIGSFVLFPEVEAGGSWYSNVLRSPAPVSDVALDFKPSARLVSDWGRHALEFRAASTLSFYNDLDSEDDRAYTLEARGRLDFTRRTNLQAFAVRDVSQESRSAIDANAAGDRATLTQHRAGGAFQHRFNRLTLQRS
ncbi:MAG: outer membrane beta-barrel protein, partial [Hyphomicrobiaceae bacterium]